MTQKSSNRIKLAYKVWAVSALIALPIYAIVDHFGSDLSHLINDPEEIKEKQKILDKSIEYHVNGQDTTVTYNLSPEDLKTLIKFKNANELKFE